VPPQRDTKSDEIYIKTDAIPRAGRDDLLLIRVLCPGENIALSGTRSDEQELIPTEVLGCYACAKYRIAGSMNRSCSQVEYVVFICAFSSETIVSMFPPTGSVRGVTGC
jgi:hypothetical protein